VDDVTVPDFLVESRWLSHKGAVIAMSHGF
jgi:hypothetical protein